MKTIKFYDTSALLVKEKFFPDKEYYVISQITLQELENIKTSTRDEETKYRARKLLRYLDEHLDDFEIHNVEFINSDTKKSNDEKILLSASNYFINLQEPADFYFVTNDLAMKALAKFGVLSHCKVISESLSHPLEVFTRK